MSDTTAANLDLCPFCEGPGEMRSYDRMCYAMCFACGAKGPLKPSVIEAKTAWNTRQPFAPDLLRACRGVSEILGVFLAPDDSDWQKVVALRDAIAKIEGR